MLLRLHSALGKVRVVTMARDNKVPPSTVVWPYSGQQDASEKPAPTGEVPYQRADGTKVNMASMNPYHRAAAIKKAERAGDADLADRLRASGPLPE